MRIDTPTGRFRRECGWASVMVLLGLIGCTASGPSDDTTITDTDETITIGFDGAEGTSNGTTNFTFQGAEFTGGTVRTVGQPSLYGSGLFAYEVLDSSPVTVTFTEPVDLLELFFVTRGSGVSEMTALGADGAIVGSLTADPATAGMLRAVTLTGDAVRVEFTHVGTDDGWIDDFTFRVAPTDGS